MRGRRYLFLRTLVMGLAVSSLVHAEGVDDLAFEWQSPDGCSTKTRLLDEVRAILGPSWEGAVSQEFEGAAILYFNKKYKVIDLWESFCFYDILEELKLVPPFWDLHKYFNNYTVK